MNKTVMLVGAMDTKEKEFLYLRDKIRENGADTLLVDVGVYSDQESGACDVHSQEVLAEAGFDLDAIQKQNDRGVAVDKMSQGIAALARRLYEEGKFDGIISMGGGGGTTVGTAAMRVLPVGVPKLMVSTIASGDTSNYVGESDILMMPSIVDIAGLNRFSEMILANAAGAIAGMVNAVRNLSDSSKELIAATMFGVTTPAVTQAKEILEEKGYEVLVFHAVGTGGKTMENLIRSGFIKGVLDVTTTELADELCGGILSAGPHRLEAAGAMGITQIVAPGALDMANFGPLESMPEKYRDRLLVPHNPLNTLMRTTAQENAELGSIIAEKLNKAKGKTIFVWPLKGMSMLDDEGKPFKLSEANDAFIKTLKEKLNENVELVELDCHINDQQFSEAIAALLLDHI
ncbi:MAG: Tm-1-like ATP-binding domain-containing protein [Bacillota bacterium]|nr:Tm-1-like ATP-binding domain-containing protein [Bacillota bacterium]MDW7678435.1 Tm-1-like ATP-binding domain-containing protein [Bacillota bacterium]